VNPTQGVLGEAWAMYRAHWRHLLQISFVVYLGVALLTLLLVVLLTWFGALIAALVSLVAAFWVQGALVRAVEDVRDGRADMTLSETFQRVQPQLPAIIVAGILAGLGVFVGLLLLIVPGLVLLTWWILIVPVIVLEEKRAGESFSRSRELVRGYGWGVFGVIVLSILIFIGFRIVLGLILLPAAEWLQSFLTEVIVGTLATPFVAIAWTLLYYRLRAAKEPPATAPPPAGPAA
jgi:hypothetical protein